MSAVQQLHGVVPVTVACDVLGLSRRAYYRSIRPPAPQKPTKPRPPPPRALDAAEQQAILDLLHSQRFLDSAPREVYATLLEEGLYHGHWRTFYRLLEAHGESRERRAAHAPRKRYATPRLVARRPNQVWTWDITLLKASGRRTLYLYVIIDIFSRYVVGWLVAEHEREELAHALIKKTIARQGIERDALTIHADRGAVMRSLTVSELLIELGVKRSHSRPRVSNDNPFSEAQFKTTKYHPTFPERFDGLGHARRFSRAFMAWYNHDHHHTALALLTPATVHYGRTQDVLIKRQAALDAAYAANPERFVNGPPCARQPPAEVWINPPNRPAQRPRNNGNT